MDWKSDGLLDDTLLTTQDKLNFMLVERIEQLEGLVQDVRSFIQNLVFQSIRNNVDAFLDELIDNGTEHFEDIVVTYPRELRDKMPSCFVQGQLAMRLCLKKLNEHRISEIWKDCFPLHNHENVRHTGDAFTIWVIDDMDSDDECVWKDDARTRNIAITRYPYAWYTLDDAKIIMKQMTIQEIQEIDCQLTHDITFRRCP